MTEASDLHIPKLYIWLERAVRVKVWVYVTGGLTFLTICFVLLLWLIEYMINGIVLLDWIEQRWYIASAISVPTVISIVMSRRDGQSTLEMFKRCSSPITDSIASSSNSVYATGGISVNGTILGPVTVALSYWGVSIWQLGTPICFFPWSRITRISDPYPAHEKNRVKVSIKQDQSWLPESFTIPWEPEMSKQIRTSNSID